MNVKGEVKRNGRIIHYVGKVCDITVDHLIPHERNGHHPYLLRQWSLAFIAAIFVLSKILLVIAPVLLPQHSVYSSALNVQNIMALTNAERTALGLPVLVSAPQLALAAQKKATDMAENAYFAHRSPTGNTMRYFIQSTGYAYQSAAENLAMRFSQAEDVAKAWMLSPTHRKNVLGSQYSQTGVGIAEGMSDGKTVLYVVQYFARPVTQVAAVVKVVENPPPTEPEPVRAALASGVVQIAVTNNNYASVSAKLVTAETILEQSPTDTWIGSLSVPTEIVNEALQITAVTDSGTIEYVPAPVINTQEVSEIFAPAASRRTALDLFGISFSIDDVNDSVERFYIAVIALLVSLLFVLLILRSQAMHPSVVTQLYSVIFLGIIVLLA